MHLIDTARAAMQEMGIEPIIVPIRGGTDGARLSYMGLPCPNLCTGGLNWHGVLECITAQALETVSQLLVKIVEKSLRLIAFPILAPAPQNARLPKAAGAM